jgi:hypothetical protein
MKTKPIPVVGKNALYKDYMGNRGMKTRPVTRRWGFASQSGGSRGVSVHHKVYRDNVSPTKPAPGPAIEITKSRRGR